MFLGEAGTKKIVASPKADVNAPSCVKRLRICGRKYMKKSKTYHNKDPSPAGDPIPAIEILNPEGQETREGACERGDTKHHGEAELHGMALVEGGEEEHNAGKEAT